MGFGCADYVRNREFIPGSVGDERFRPPEMVEKGQSHFPGSDIWSLGVLLYVLLTGSYPYVGGSTEDLFNSIMIGKYFYPLSAPLRPKFILSQMLSVDPEFRPSTLRILSEPWMCIS